MKKSCRLSSRCRKGVSFVLLVLMMSSFFNQAVWGGPTGENIIFGNGSVNRSGNETRITQNSDKLIINWQQFGSAANEAILFNQPGSSSIALNRVIGAFPSSLLGLLTANGHVWLLNPYGIVFGPSGQVNVGAILASTLKMADQDFINGSYRLSQDLTRAMTAVVNQGRIEGTSVALIAPLVYNTGNIIVNSGRVTLGGTSQATVSIDPQNLIQFTSQNQNNPPGPVVMQARDVDDLLRSVVNNREIFPAGSIITNSDGTVTLTGVSGSVVSGGSLRANGGAAIGSKNISIQADYASVLPRGSSLSATASGGGPGGVIYVFSDKKIYLSQAIVTSNALFGNILFASSGDLTAESSTISGENGGGVSLLSATGMKLNQSRISLTNGNRNLSNDLRVSTDGVLNLSGTTIVGKNQRDVIVFGDKGLAMTNTSISQDTGRDLKVLSEGDLESKTSSVTATNNQNLVVSAEKNMRLINSSFSHTASRGNTNIYTIDDMFIEESTFTNNAVNNVTIQADRNLWMSRSRLSNFLVRDTTLSAANNLSLGQSLIQADQSGNLLFAAQRGNLSTANSEITHTNGNRNISTKFTARGNLTMAQTKVTSSQMGQLNLQAGQDIVLDNSSINRSWAYDTFMNAGRDLSLVNGSRVVTDHDGSVSLTAGHNVNVLSGSAIEHNQGWDTGLKAGNDINLQHAKIAASNTHNSILDAGHDINLTDHSSFMASGGYDLMLAAGHDIGLGSSSVGIWGGHDLAFWALGNVRINASAVQAENHNNYTISGDKGVSAWGGSTLSGYNNHYFFIVAANGPLSIDSSSVASAINFAGGVFSLTGRNSLTLNRVSVTASGATGSNLGSSNFGSNGPISISYSSIAVSNDKDFVMWSGTWLGIDHSTISHSGGRTTTISTAGDISATANVFSVSNQASGFSILAAGGITLLSSPIDFSNSPGDFNIESGRGLNIYNTFITRFATGFAALRSGGSILFSNSKMVSNQSNTTFLQSFRGSITLLYGSGVSNLNGGSVVGYAHSGIFNDSTSLFYASPGYGIVRLVGNFY